MAAGAVGWALIALTEQVVAQTASSPVSGVGSAPRSSCIDADVVRGWSPQRQAGQVLMFSIQPSNLGAAPEIVRRLDLAGFLVRGNPAKADVAKLIALRDSKRAVDMPTMVAVDEEGGRVQHLRTLIGPLASPRAQSRLPVELVRKQAAAHARRMRALGFTVNFGPVADLASSDPKLKNGIGDRAYSADPAIVAAAAGAFADGMIDGGILPVLKHFPGHGNATGDTHNSGARTPEWSLMKLADATPFQAIANVRPGKVAIMTGHLHVPGLTDRPASIAAPALKVLRDDWGFDGLVVTDSLSMWAVRARFDAVNAAVEALKAGNDLLLFDEEPNIGAIVSGLAAATQADKVLASRLVQANLRVLRAAGANVCPGSLLLKEGTSGALATTSVKPAA